MKFEITMNDNRTFNVVRLGSSGSDSSNNLTFDKVLKLFLKTFYAELPELNNPDKKAGERK